MLNYFNCDVCGNPHTLDGNRKKKRAKYTFCSAKCRKTPFVKKQCIECKKVYLVVARGAGKDGVCSKSCQLARNRRKQVHKKGKLAKCTCERCGNTYKVRPSVAKVQRYCSQACSGKEIGKKAKGSNNPQWKPKKKIDCAHCGKIVEFHPSRMGRKKYCSKKCRVIGNLKRLSQNPRTDIEIAMARQLDKLDVSYQEQVLFFDKFLVDFFIPNHNLIIQCDGTYWHDRPKVKARDKGQDNYFKKCGYTVLRFTDKQIYNDIDECGKVISLRIIGLHN